VVSFDPIREQPLIDIRSVGRDFPNGLRALDNVSLGVRGGDFVSLVGPSGCGKSTLLRLIAGLDTPTSGRIDWPHGRPIPGDVAMVFQEPTLLPWATVFENVRLPLQLTRRTRDWRDQVMTAIDLVGLHDFANSYPRQLSGGMKMRASLARALVTEPRLLLLDEPFAALDEITRFKLNEDLLRIWRTQRCSILFVTHSVFEAVFLSRHIAVMSPRPGRIVADADNPLPYPRASSLRTEPAYSDLCRLVSDELARAMAAPVTASVRNAS
jgi:NitT/TauT family transport system ATP-binding protein